MSGKLEIAIGSLIMGLICIGLELAAVWTYTGTMPWNL